LADTTFGRWAAPEISLSIEYRLDVMEEIRAAACESLRQFSTGGLDVGGVLFGTHQDNLVRILTWRPISSEHAEGPELRLSADDRRDLVRQLLAAKQDPALQSLQPVGWFLSHMRSGISLSDADLEVFDGYFGEPWQVTLVLLPAPEGTARAGFFVRQGGGKLRSESSYREFTIQPPSALPLKANYFRWLWAIPTLIAMILAGVLIKPSHPAPVNPGIFLRIQDAQINWDANSSTVRGAKRAEIEIQDGGQPSRVQLTGAQLASGKMAWQRHSGDVQVRMTVYPASGSIVRESARLVVSTVSVPASPAPDTHAEELKKLNEELHQERVRSEKLQNMVKILENRLEIDTARGK
jgi:proteasome lid subunit RPN8/RPN11